MQSVIPPTGNSIGELPKGKILIIEQVAALRKALVDFLNEHYVVSESESVDAGKIEIRRMQPDLVLLGRQLLDVSAAEVLDSLKTASSSPIAIVVLSGQTTIDEAVAAVKAGAADLISTPVEPARLHRT